MLSINAEIVNNQRNSVWQFRCTYTPLGSVIARPSTALSDLMMLQRVAERAVPPGSRAGRSRKVAEMAVLGVYFEHLYTGVNGVGKRDITVRWRLVVCNPPRRRSPLLHPRAVR